METKLRKPERQTRILEELRLTPHVRISDLAERFKVTTETVRRDLDELSQQGLVNRAFGGASAHPMGFQPPVEERDQAFIAQRTAIGAHAASLLRSGEVIMIDAGSTTAQLARHLAPSLNDIRIITNSYRIAVDAASLHHHVVVCPGEFNDHEGAVYGPDATNFLARFNANKAFIGAGGISADGFSDVNRAAVWIKRCMIERAQETWLLLHHEKFDVRLLEIVAELQCLTGLVTDKTPPSELRRALEKNNVDIQVAASA